MSNTDYLYFQYSELPYWGPDAISTGVSGSTSVYFANKRVTWNDTKAALPKTDSKTNATAKLHSLGM